ncbi:hypothetical protein D8S78_15155 [Natrialba swarupiae]|nr:hypothetical protein [Natrialba swarupiae]
MHAFVSKPSASIARLESNSGSDEPTFFVRSRIERYRSRSLTPALSPPSTRAEVTPDAARDGSDWNANYRGTGEDDQHSHRWEQRNDRTDRHARLGERPYAVGICRERDEQEYESVRHDDRDARVNWTSQYPVAVMFDRGDEHVGVAENPLSQFRTHAQPIADV